MFVYLSDYFRIILLVSGNVDDQDTDTAAFQDRTVSDLGKDKRNMRKIRYQRGTKVKIVNFSEYCEYLAASSGYSQQFQLLEGTNSRFTTNDANRARNFSKNRYADILPFDHSRVKLVPLPREDASDYINANFIPGFNQPKEYIACQGPTKETIGDFWRMIWDHQCKIIVMLTQCQECGRVKCEQYWPDPGQTNVFFGMKIFMLSEQDFRLHTERRFQLQKQNEVREALHFQFLEWPDFSCPEEPSTLVEFITIIRAGLTEDYWPIVVHCSAGIGRTGAFIAVDILMHHLRLYDYVDVYGLIEELRYYRIKMVQTEVQYVFVHECIRYIVQNMFQEDVLERPIVDTSKNSSSFDDDDVSEERRCLCTCCGVPWFSFTHFKS